MAFSYSGITNYGKSSLPSVESWGTNHNILRDPPKSVMTRRRDKYSESSFLTQEIQDSSDRIAEAIMAYPRGVNPMVGVSYGNSNGNGGITSGQALYYHGKQAKLPYRVMDGGAFRPPILAPVDLLPLSRMPRNTTAIEATIFNPDYSRKLTCGTEARNTKPVLLNPECTSSLFFKIQQATPVPVSEVITPLTYHIDPRVKYQAGKDQRARHTLYSTKDPLSMKASAHMKGPIKYSNLAADVRTRANPLKVSGEAPKSGLAHIEKFNAKVPVKSPVLASAQSQVGGPRKYSKITTDFKMLASPLKVAGETAKSCLGNTQLVNPKLNLKTPLHTTALSGFGGAGQKKFINPSTVSLTREAAFRAEGVTNKSGLQQYKRPEVLPTLRDPLAASCETNQSGLAKHLRAEELPTLRNSLLASCETNQSSYTKTMRPSKVIMNPTLDRPAVDTQRSMLFAPGGSSAPGGDQVYTGGFDRMKKKGSILLPEGLHMGAVHGSGERAILPSRTRTPLVRNLG